MTWVKVCGLTAPEHVAAAEAAGADAVGFVLVPGSPRAISEDEVAGLIDHTSVTSVLLTLDRTPSELLALVTRLRASAVQPYGDYAAAASAAAGEAGLMVLRPIAADQIPSAPLVPAGEIPLIDHRSDGRLGGTGQAFDWALLAGLDRQIVLAGGLHPGNVTGAIRAARPWGVDASSGLESSPGVKDTGLIETFIKRAKRA